MPTLNLPVAPGKVAPYTTKPPREFPAAKPPFNRIAYAAARWPSARGRWATPQPCWSVPPRPAIARPARTGWDRSPSRSSGRAPKSATDG